MITHLAVHELRVMLRSPFAWLAAGLLQLLFGWLFLSAIERYLTLQTSAAQSGGTGLSSYLIVHFFAPVSIVFMIATPLLCMHLVAGEKQANRYALLLSLPVTGTHYILGKFIGATVYQLLILALTGVLFAILSVNIKLQISHLVTAGAGLFLFITTITALTLFYSSLTKRPMIAAFTSFVTVALLWMAAATSTGGMLQFASPSAHLHSFMQGWLDSRDIVYFIAVTGALLSLGIWRFDAQRSHGNSHGSFMGRSHDHSMKNSPDQTPKKINSHTLGATA